MQIICDVSLISNQGWGKQSWVPSDQLKREGKWKGFVLRWPCDSKSRSRSLKVLYNSEVNGAYKHGKYEKKKLKTLPIMFSVKVYATHNRWPHNWLHRPICYSCGSKTGVWLMDSPLNTKLHSCILTINLPLWSFVTDEKLSSKLRKSRTKS